MTTTLVITPALFTAGLLVLTLRRLVSPTRFAQALGGVAIGTLMAAGLAQCAGGGHG